MTKIGIVVQRYGNEVSGGGEYEAKLFAELLLPGLYLLKECRFRQEFPVLPSPHKQQSVHQTALRR